MYVTLISGWTKLSKDAFAEVKTSDEKETPSSYSSSDLGAFFTFSALLIFYGVLKSKGECLRIVALLIGLAAFLRIVAWAINDAALASTLIGAEIVLVVWLWLSAKYIDKLKQVNGANE